MIPAYLGVWEVVGYERDRMEPCCAAAAAYMLCFWSCGGLKVAVCHYVATEPASKDEQLAYNA